MIILRKYDSSLLLSEFMVQKVSLGFLFTLTVKVLSIHDIVHCVHQTVFVHNARSDTTKFSHLGTDTEKKTNMDTHCTNICSSFTRDPENTQSGLQCQYYNKKVHILPSIFIKFKKFGFVNCSNSELTFHSRDQWRALKHCSGQSFNGF